MNNNQKLYTLEDLEVLLDSLPCSIFIKDGEGKYIYSNKFAADIAGLEKSSILGKTDLELKDEDEALKSLETDRKVLKGNKHLLTEESGINKAKNQLFDIYKFPIDQSKKLALVSREININRALKIDFEKITCQKPTNSNKYDYQEFLIEILNKISTILDNSNVNLFLYDSSELTLSSYSASTNSDNIFKDNIIIDVDNIFLDKISKSDENNVYFNSLLSNHFKDNSIEEAYSKFLIKPLYFAGNLIGLLHIYNHTHNKYGLHNEAFINDICDNLSSFLLSFGVTNEFEKYIFKDSSAINDEHLSSTILSKMNHFATLSHELKTPINIILSSIQLLLNLLSNNLTIDNTSLLKYLTILKQNSYRLLRLVNNVLDSNKVENKFNDLALVNCNVVNIIENIVLSTCDYLEQNNREIIFDTDEEEVFLSCDPDKIEKVILNLISNSLKFTDDNGKISVNICTNFKDKKLFVHLKNNGPEISEEDSKKIFSKFIQSDELFLKKSQGTGIGLYLCRSFIELHGGHIWVNPEFKDGAEFIFYLPIRLDSSKKFLSLDTDLLQSKTEQCNIEFSDVYSM